MKRRFYYIFIFTLFIIFTSCEEHDNGIELAYEPCFKTFSFLVADNPQLEADVVLSINSDTVSVFVPYLKTDNLIATFSGDYEEAWVGEARQISGVSSNDFSQEVVYVLKDGTDNTHQYVFHLLGYNGLPRIEIDTQDHKPVESKEDYLSCFVRILNAREFCVSQTKASIKGRGNATWRDYPKKPYKIKLDENSSLFGFPSNKDWVLLAEFLDKSLIRTSFMCAVSRAVGMDYTINCQHVELFLNGEYEGIYLLTEQVEKAKGRVEIEDDGFIVEDDWYYNQEPLSFTTDAMALNYTFKYPNADKGKIVKDDANYAFIKKMFNDFETSLQKIPEDCESYRQFIDINSFAKWYVATEVIGNWDPNLFYVLPSKNAKLKMTPMWDGEWTFGLAREWNRTPFRSEYNVSIWRDWKYFKYLFQDPGFNLAVKEEWNHFKECVPNIKERVAKTAVSLQYALPDYFERWDILGKKWSVMRFAFESWEEDYNYVCDYFDKRIEWMDSLIN